MLTDFNTLPNSSRLWIYQSSIILDENKIHFLKSRLSTFCEKWESHQRILKSAYEIRYNKFVILSVDEMVNDASGCSIDKSVKLFQELEIELNSSFLDKSLIPFKVDDEIITVKLSEIKNSIETGYINENSVLINTLVQTKESYNNEFEILAKNSWLKRYFLKVEL